MSNISTLSSSVFHRWRICRFTPALTWGAFHTVGTSQVVQASSLLQFCALVSSSFVSPSSSHSGFWYCVCQFASSLEFGVLLSAGTFPFFSRSANLSFTARRNCSGNPSSISVHFFPRSFSSPSRQFLPHEAPAFLLRWSCFLRTWSTCAFLRDWQFLERHPIPGVIVGSRWHQMALTSAVALVALPSCSPVLVRSSRVAALSGCSWG